MTERMFHVTFPDGERANIYARGLSVAWGTAEGKRRRAAGENWGYWAIDMDTELCASFREMPVEQQIAESPRCDFKTMSIWLMGPDERLSFGDLLLGFEDSLRLPVAEGFCDRQSQEDWEKATLELAHA
jgi:hypothetical protein